MNNLALTDREQLMLTRLLAEAIMDTSNNAKARVYRAILNKLDYLPEPPKSCIVTARNPRKIRRKGASR